MFSALFRKYIAVFLEKRRKGNFFLFVDRFLDFRGLCRGPLFLCFVYRGNVIFLAGFFPLVPQIDFLDLVGYLVDRGVPG